VSDHAGTITRLSLVERIWAKRIKRHSPRELFEMLRTPVGRRQLWRGFQFLLWPATSRLAFLYRCTLARRVRITAVVGSLGKTTTAHAVAAALGLNLRHRLSTNSLSGVPRTILRLRPWDARMVIEAGIDGKRQMAPMVRMVRPSVAVVTSIASEHNRSLETLEGARHEKAYMVRALPPSGVAVLNGDDPNVLWMAGQTRARVVTFGFGEANQVRATGAELDWPRGMRFRLHAGGCEREVRIGLLGRHMIYAALAAVAVALEEGVSLDDVLPRLAALAPVTGRMAVKLLENGSALLCDDKKSALESIHAALDLLEEVPAQRKIVVLGPINEPLGSAGPLYRALGARIARIAQLAVLVDSYREYKGGLFAGGMKREQIFNAGVGCLAAAEYLRRELRPGDVALIKGRDQQKLARVALALEGRQVSCSINCCRSRALVCERCPMLER
jgi:UDP-N-acetylmuramyl pentapeptide synthase